MEDEDYEHSPSGEVPYNKQFTNFTFSGPHWGILVLGRFCSNVAALGPYCFDLGPIFPSTVNILSIQTELFSTDRRQGFHVQSESPLDSTMIVSH